MHREAKKEVSKPPWVAGCWVADFVFCESRRSLSAQQRFRSLGDVRGGEKEEARGKTRSGREERAGKQMR